MLKKFGFVFCFALFFFGCASLDQDIRDSLASAPLTNQACQDGATREGFIASTTTGDIPCARGLQTCVAGKWQGPEFFPTCESYTKSCDGQAHGTVLNGYLHPTMPHGVPCIVATKTCLNGTWTGPEVFPSCTEN